MPVAPPALTPDSTAPAPRRAVAASAQRLSRIIALALGWAAGIVILGWILDVRLLKGFVPGLISMKLNTALGFALAGCGLIRMTRERSRRRQAALGAICAAAVFAIGFLTILEHATGLSLGIDQALVADSQDDGNPGAYVSDHSNVRFSHGVCPGCVQTVLKPELEELKRTRAQWGKPT